MSDFSSSDWPHWNTLTPTFRNSYSLTNQVVYDAAGEIWPSALKFAASRNIDTSDAREALLRAAGSVSGQRASRIKSLRSYLFKAYANRILRQLQKETHYTSLDSINEEIGSDPGAAEAIEDKLVLAEIVARMDDDTRRIYEGLILGYSFEELAKEYGKPSNLLRSKFSKGVKRIARDIKRANS